MKKILIFFVLSIIIISNVYGNLEKTNQIIKLEKENIYLKLEKDVNYRSVKIKTNKNNIEIENFNPKFDYIVTKFMEFEDIDLLISIANSYNIDWRLIAVQIFYESAYDVDAESTTGAKGLMQLTSWVTGKDANIKNTSHNIFIGISYYDYLYKERFNHIVNENERIKFALAAYHDGPGKVNRCRKKAKAQGLNPNKFSNIKKFLSNDAQKYVGRIIRAYSNIEST